MNLATLTHISDLHFGIPDPDTYDAKTLQLWAAVPGFEGYLGHKYSALMFLEDFWENQLAQHDNGYERAKLIVSGDLTTKGHLDEFDTAVEFISDELVPPRGGGLGLGIDDWQDWTIPGNHDHWSGSLLMIGKSTIASQTPFRPTPFWTSWWIPPENGNYTIRFLFIDTCKDVSRFHPDRVWARGSFVSELEHLGQKLRPREEHEIRVLCLHHSPAFDGYSKGIDLDSQSELAKFIIDQEISVLLCGHIHGPPMVKAFTAVSGNKSRLYLEARCGTTTQQDFLDSPYYWRKARKYFQDAWRGTGGGSPKRVTNTLLVYRIEEQRDGVYWDSELYALGTNGFELVQNPPQGEMADMHFKVL